jgi:hypothetical protein
VLFWSPADPIPSSSDWSSSSAGSGGTVPSSRSVMAPVAAVHVVGTNVASGGSPPRHTGAAAPVAATRDGGALSTQSNHHVAPFALAAMESKTNPASFTASVPELDPPLTPIGPDPEVARSAAPTPPAPQSAPPAKDDNAAAAAAAAGR